MACFALISRGLAMLADGFADVVGAFQRVSAQSSTLCWQRFNGTGFDASLRIIDTVQFKPSQGYCPLAAKDLSGDGRPDIVFLVDSSTLAWYVNSNGNFSFGRQVIPHVLPSGCSSIFLVDFDLDGWNDIILDCLRANGSIALFRNAHAGGYFPSMNVVRNSSWIVEFSSVTVDEFIHGSPLGIVLSLYVRSAILLVNSSSLQVSVVDDNAFLPLSLASGRVDAGDSVDLLAANSGGVVYLYANQGRGTFAPPRVLLSGSNVGMFAADFNLDGSLDVALSLVVHLNDKSGVFRARMPSSMRIVGFLPRTNDSNNGATFVLADSTDQLFYVPPGPNHHQQRSASFATSVAPIAVAVQAPSIVVADFSMDGHSDIAVADAPSTVTILFGDGRGGVVSQQVVATLGDRPSAIVTGDMDSSGSPDLCLAGLGIVCLLNDENWAPYWTPSPLPWYHVDLGDIDGDLDLDVCAGFETDGETRSCLSCWTNDGTGTSFSHRPVSDLLAPFGVLAVRLADVTGDQVADLFYINQTEPYAEAGMLIWLDLSTSPGVHVLDDQVASLFLGDVNGDGALDVVFQPFSYASDTVYVMLNVNGSGMFNSSKGFGLDAISALRHLADVDGNGYLDVLLSSSDGSVLFLLNNGKGSFGDYQRILLGDSSFAYEQLAKDFTGDGFPDIVMSQNNAIALLANTPFLTNARPYTAQPVPLPCRAVPSGAACWVERATATLSKCFASHFTMPRDTAGCLARPLTLADVAPLTVDGAGNAIACTARDRQTLLVAGSNADVTFVNITIDASRASGVPSASRGVLSVCDSSCAVSMTAVLRLINVTLTGFVTARPVSLLSLDSSLSTLTVFGRGSLFVSNSRLVNNTSPLGAGAILLLGRASRAMISHSILASNRATGEFGSEFAGGGAIGVYGPSAKLELSACLLDANTAGAAGGGALVVSGMDAFVSLSRVTIANSHSDLGSGGALLVQKTAARARVTLVDCAIRNCSATAGAGGAIALFGATGALVNVTGSLSSLSNCSASYGGALAVASSLVGMPSVLAVTSMASLPRGLTSVLDVGRIVVDETVALFDNSAMFGGTVFVCDGSIGLAPSAALLRRSHAFLGGGFGFVCSPSDNLVIPAASQSASSVSQTGYGSVLAGPPARIELGLFPAAAMSGVSLGSGRATLFDMYDQTVRLEAISLRSVREDGQPSVQGGTLVASPDANDATYSFAPVVLMQSDWPGSLGLPVGLRIGIDAVGSILQTGPHARIQVNITGCLAGWGRSSANDAALVCTPCTGESSSSASSAALGGTCQSCPANTYRSSAGTCLCLAGFYESLASGAADAALCQPCPPGGLCTGGSAAPVAAPGFYPEDGTSGVFVACVNPRACLGNGACARGFTGRLCGKCAGGWYALNGSCRRCNPATAVLASIGLVFLALGVAAALLWFNLATSLGYKFGAISIGLAALQVLALFGRLQLDWGPLPETVFRLASTLSLNVQLTSPECSLGRETDAWQLRFWLTMALPILAALALMLVALPMFFMLRRTRRTLITLAELAGGVRRSWFQALTLLYVPLIASALSVFGCRRDAANVWVLLDDPSNRCFNARWWRVLFVPGLIFGVLYGLFIPLLLVELLRRARRALSEGEFYLRYGFAVARFTSSFWYFEFVIMCFKLALVLALTAFASADGKAGAGVMVLAGWLVHLVAVRPYVRPIHQAVAVSCQAAITLTLLGGTLDDWLFRRLIASAGVLATLVSVAVGLGLDLVAFQRQERAARTEHAFSAKRAEASELDSDGAVELDFQHDVRRGMLGENDVAIQHRASIMRDSTDHIFVDTPPSLPIFDTRAAVS